MELSFSIPDRVDVVSVVRPMQRGAADPTFRINGNALWRTVTTPEGPATAAMRFEHTDRTTRVQATLWGPGAQHHAAQLRGFVGGSDDPAGFKALLEQLRDDNGLSHEQQSLVAFVRRHWMRRVWRVPRSLNVWEATLAAVLEQKVTGKESRGAWRRLAEEYGDPAPGPAPEGMRSPPTTAQIRRVPSWKWRNLAVDRSRSDTLMRLARSPALFERLVQLPSREARTVMTSIPGVGDWTYAEVAQRALGDPDAVSFGDYHLARVVVHAVTGRRNGTDEELAQLLVPFIGHRYRAVRMVELHGSFPDRRGPRMSVPRSRYGFT